MNILVINCGSSSLKYQLIDMTNESVTAKGLCERIGIEGSNLVHQPAGKGKLRFEKPMPDHKVAIQMVLDALVDPEHGVVKSVDEINAKFPEFFPVENVEEKPKEENSKIEENTTQPSQKSSHNADAE